MRAIFAAIFVVSVASPALAQEDVEESSTPRRALESFISAARDGDYAHASRFLDLSGLPARDRARLGPGLARKLKVVLDQELWVDFARVPEETDEDRVVLGTIAVEHRNVPVELSRRGQDGAWLISRRTVESIPALYEAHGAAWVERLLPESFSRIHFLEMELWQWIGLLFALGLGYVAGVIVAGLVLRVLARLAARTKTEWDDRLIELGRTPTRVMLTLLTAWILIELLHLSHPAQETVNKLLLVALIGTLAWYATRSVRFAAERVEKRAMARAERQELDEIAVRGVRTQVVVLRRVASIIIGIVAVSLMLVQFDVVRTVGMSLLASAGIAGVVLGLAAQRSIASLLAGIQLSITQPMRIGDTVVLEGESGMIEEINLTYVVVKIWDQRRLIVPMNRFLEQPFQNLTKVSPELLGTVFLYADYRLPIEAIRTEFDRILESHPKWDRREKNLMVSDATDRTVQLRALVSAKDASHLGDLRSDVRERLVAFLRDYQEGRYLPRTRVEDQDEDGVTEPSPARDSAPS